MIKRFRSLEINTETMQIFQGGKQIECPYDIYKAFSYMCTFEYLTDNYDNSDDVLWDIAVATRENQDEAEANGNPITESEAIEIACKSFNITLTEE